MRMIMLAAAVVALGSPAFAASNSPSVWSAPTHATPVAAETCASAAAAYEAAAKAHATSPNMTKAKEDADKGKAACAAGKSADGIADYDAATKLLGA